MNKKTRTRILIVIVGAVWLYNIYRTYSNYQASEELAESDVSYSMPTFSPVMFNKDSFDLELPEVDPFLKQQTRGMSSTGVNKNITQSNSTKNKSNSSIKPPKQQNPIVKSWPQIKYFGFVKSHDKQDALCLIQINGKNSKVSKGDRLSGVYVSRVFRDSVLLVYEGEEKTFKKG